MFQQLSICIFFIFVSLTHLQAQEVTISYQHTVLENGQSTTQIYLQANAEDSLIIRAVNFSFLMDKSCAKFADKKSIFAENWSQFLERQFVMDSVKTELGDFNYRVLYGIAEPQGMKGTRSIKIPGTKGEPMLMLSMTFEGDCAAEVRMEHETENAMNQIGDTNLSPLPYTLVHPGDE